MGTTVEWDPEKSRVNLRKHGIGFPEALTVLDDPLSITIPDPDHSFGEVRFLDLGLSSGGRLLVICYTERRGLIRLISARKASRQERREYESARN